MSAYYSEVGAKEDNIAADILDRKLDLAEVAIYDFMPVRLMLKESTRRWRKASWQFTSKALKQAAMRIDENGKEIRQDQDLDEPSGSD